MTVFEEIYAKAKEWTLIAGENLRVSVGQQLKVEYKTSEADLVTEKDREIESFFRKKIKESFPSHHIIGEEETQETESFDPLEEVTWLIDPIDGTTSFVHQKENFAISVAVYEKGSPKIGIIYDPIKGELFHTLIGKGAFLNDRRLPSLKDVNVKHSLIGINSLWLIPNDYYEYTKLHPLIKDARGTRIIGSAALEMAAVACGRLNSFICLKLSPWDYAAGYVLLKELGAKLTTIENKRIPLFESVSIFVASEGLHEEIIENYLHG